ncbi:hypothetical protein PILCRDRAFT_499863 [Piloderma croceum F 1598]|uniref:Uncharacterized protein n=1 Tax=Piloderma croceum (strain F 1598) TaxID=765440 RepID=A0A0C3FNP2_PILCF|nr:hypothetical protein PILCRDRAFT_499863 [Piloderma croceum F 1598]
MSTNGKCQSAAQLERHNCCQQCWEWEHNDTMLLCLVQESHPLGQYHTTSLVLYRMTRNLLAMHQRHSSLGLRRSHIPTDVEIRSISSHAQAEALVQHAQQSIFDMEYILDDNPLSPGRLPLSAKLAAYGESLALERQLKQVEEGMTGEEPLSAEESEVPVIAVFTRDAGKKTASLRVSDTRVSEGPKFISFSYSPTEAA